MMTPKDMDEALDMAEAGLRAVQVNLPWANFNHRQAIFNALNAIERIRASRSDDV